MLSAEPPTTEKSPPLLDMLLALKPNIIYTMGNPKEISAASAAYSQGIVDSFCWGGSGQLLEAQLNLPGKPSILLTCQDGNLVTSANPNRAHTVRNVLASIMTITRVLLGTKFHRNDLPLAKIEKFRSELRAPEPESDSEEPKVVLTEGSPGRPFDWDYHSGLREPSWRVVGPPSGMEWLSWQERTPERFAEGFCQWLAGNQETVDIEVRTHAGAMLLKGAQVKTVRCTTQLEVQGGDVVIHRAVLDEDGKSLDPFIDIGFGLVLLEEQGCFARVQPEGAWKGFERFEDRPAGARRLQTPANRFCTAYPSELDRSWEFLGAQGQAVTPMAVGCCARLDAISAGTRVRVHLRVTSDRGHEIPPHCLISRAFEDLFLDGPFALLVQSHGRRRKLAELLAELALEEGDIETRLLSAASAPAFTSRQMHGDDAARCLRSLREKFRQLDKRHLVVAPGHPDNPWLACTHAGRSLARALGAFVRAFPGEDPLRAKELVCELGGLRFFEALPALISACDEFGVELRLDDKTTMVEKLEVSVRIVRDGEIDWFELHPEAHAGELTIPRSQWEQILLSGHLCADDETLISFDSASLDRLRRLAALLGVEDNKPAIRRPRLQLFDWLALRRDGIACELPPEDEAVMASLQHLAAIPAQPLPRGLRADLREYQRHGYDWLCFLYRHRFGACLADDMGLGKTLQAIALLAALNEGLLPRQVVGCTDPHLIVLPPTLLFNWQSEIERFAPALKIHEYTGLDRTLDFSGADIVMTTYDLARRDIEALAAVPFDVVVFDEAQAVKNAVTARTRAMTRIRARFRLCLTGTPLENHIGEFHSIIETAVPGLFGDRKAFLRDHEAGLPVLERVRPFLLRRTKKNILSELPPKVESDAYFPLSDSQRECYTQVVGEVRKEVLAAFEDRPAQQAGIAALAALLRLRQICVSPAMLPGEFPSDSPKIDYLVDQLAELAEEGHAALVFSQFVKALKLTGAALESSGLPFLHMDGSTPTKARKSLVEGFQSGTGPGIFLISLKTGGSGLNLTRASYVYHLDPWWNPAVENQASDRVYRIGQQSSVFVQRLLMRHTVEEKMMVLKEKKQALFSAVLNQGNASSSQGLAALTAEDFRFLIDP